MSSSKNNNKKKNFAFNYSYMLTIFFIYYGMTDFFLLLFIIDNLCGLVTRKTLFFLSQSHKKKRKH